jgi:nicotinamide mononucleotide (NMN) deamidase PncC
MKLVLSVTGGGTGVFNTLLSKGGASSFFLEGNIPYSPESLKQLLGYTPERACTEEVSRRMAMQSFKRAMQLGASEDEATGIGVTATLAKKGEERADRVHQFHIATQNNKRTACSSFLFNLKYPREYEEVVVAEMTQHIIDKGQHPAYVGSMVNGLSVDTSEAFDTYNILPVILGKLKSSMHGCNNLEPNPFIYPGSFNPIHDGHCDIIQWCNDHMKRKPYLEISITNPDKPSLDFLDIKDRISTIYQKVSYTYAHKNDCLINGVLLTNAPRFYDKSWLYNSPSFIVGADTFLRILERKYYADDKEFENFVDHIKVNQTQFFVLDRKGFAVDNNHVQRLGLSNLVHTVSSSEYVDKGVSSTQIRRKKESLWLK